MNSKHTPGPWRVSLAKTATGEFLIHGCGTGRGLSFYEPSVAVASEYPDAALIAAAPDLLEAAEQVCSLSKIASESTHPHWAALRQAIAKSRGEP